MSETTLGSRIRMARKHAGKSVDVLAGEVERTAFTFYRYEWGQLKPPIGVIATIADRCGVSLPWLELGQGPMVPRTARRA